MLGRTHYCGEIRESQSGETVTLKGWVQRRRDLGGVIFIDLRDYSGIIQVVFHPEISEQALKIADEVRNEFVLDITGEVIERDAETVNPKIPTGQIEIQAESIEILNEAKTPPFPIEDGIDAAEDVRLKYRYLDLRRPQMQENFRMRHRVTKVIRDYLDEHYFTEIETPMLTKSTPEGARDYLVPSRVNEGKFYALPQSPQLFKQLLMVSGFDRYFQVVRCFRDEDLRADRQPEFTQVDIETSFMEAEDLLSMMEAMLKAVVQKAKGVTIEGNFPRMTYAEAMERYGTDKPDTRFGMELVNVSELVKDSDFKVFKSAVEKGGEVKAINVKAAADDYSRADIDGLIDFVSRFGAKGLAWFKAEETALKGPVTKFFSADEQTALREALSAEAGDLLLFVADQPQVVADSLSHLRTKFAEERELIDDGQLNFLWVTDFPLFEYDDEAKRYVSMHHPFTKPKAEDADLLDTTPEKARAEAYDIVLNGYEIGGGSRRIHDEAMQHKMFRALGFSEEEAKQQFGFLLDALQFGAPPHGGIAFGLDRIVMILAEMDTLRDVITFPKTASAGDPLTEAPSEVSRKQLDELHLKIKQS